MHQRRPSPDLVAYLNSRVEDLRRLVPRALLNWDVEAIHHTRVTTRRLKAAVDLLEPMLPDEERLEFAAVLRRLRRSLGPLRDLDVMLLHLKEYQKQRRLAGAVSWLVHILQQQRLQAQRRACRKAPSNLILKNLGTWWAMEQPLDGSEQAQASLVRRAIPRQLSALPGAPNHLAELGALDRPAGQNEDVHALRIDGKLLRYALELAVPIGFPLPAPLFRTFKRLQDALGLWHDYVVLGEQCLRSALDAQVPLHDPALYGQLLQLAQRCWRDSQAQLAHFARLWKEIGPAVQGAILTALSPTAELLPSPEEPAAPGPSSSAAPGSAGESPDSADGAASPAPGPGRVPR